MVWDNIPKAEARQMASVWAIQEARERHLREAVEQLTDPPPGSSAPAPQERAPWQDAVGYLDLGHGSEIIEFRAQYRNGQWWSQGSDEPMRRTTHAHLKDDPSTVLWDKRSKRNSNPLEDWLSSGKGALSKYLDQKVPNTRPEFKEIPGDDFITHELMGALAKLFGQVRVARHENSKRLGGVEYRLWVASDDGKFPLGGWIYRHPKIKFLTSINGKFDFGDGRQGSFIMGWDSRLSAAEQPFEGLLFTKERHGEELTLSECPQCGHKSMFRRGPQDACHACSRTSFP